MEISDETKGAVQEVLTDPAETAVRNYTDGSMTELDFTNIQFRNKIDLLVEPQKLVIKGILNPLSQMIVSTTSLAMSLVLNRANAEGLVSPELAKDFLSCYGLLILTYVSCAESFVLHRANKSGRDPIQLHKAFERVKAEKEFRLSRNFTEDEAQESLPIEDQSRKRESSN